MKEKIRKCQGSKKEERSKGERMGNIGQSFKKRKQSRKSLKKGSERKQKNEK